VEKSLEMELLLAPPAERFEILCREARTAFEAERNGDRISELHFSNLGFAALLADPALGLLIARGALPVCGWVNQSTLMGDIEDARDLLGLDDNEPGYQIMEAADQASADRQRHAMDMEQVRTESASRVRQREEEIRRLKAQIDTMQETLKQREVAGKPATSARVPAGPAAPAPAPPPAESAETRELRENLRRLKDNLKVEHDERNRALQELRAARDQLRRSARERPEQRAPEPQTPAPEPDPGDCPAPDIEWERQPLRIPEYSPAIRQSLRNQPRQAAAAALAIVGRLAAGDPATWKTVRALKLRPGTLRVRVAGDYRLLFETGPDQTLQLVDFILRRDLDRWLAAAGR
jgi:hypothetical protein